MVLDPKLVQTMNDLMPIIGGLIKLVGIFLLAFFVGRMIAKGLKND